MYGHNSEGSLLKFPVVESGTDGRQGVSNAGILAVILQHEAGNLYFGDVELDLQPHIDFV